MVSRSINGLPGGELSGVAGHNISSDSSPSEMTSYLCTCTSSLNVSLRGLSLDEDDFVGVSGSLTGLKVLVAFRRAVAIVNSDGISKPLNSIPALNFLLIRY